LFDNKLEGKLPYQLGELKDLTELMLANNDLTGFIPKELSNLKELRVLQLQNNKFNGGLEFSVDALPSLVQLDFDEPKKPKFKSMKEVNSRLANTIFADDDDNE
jgi:hypothetical protein